MLEETVAGIDPAGGGTYLDLSLGAGGHAEALLERSSPEGILYGLDRDPQVLEFARKRLERFGERVRLQRGNFSEADVIFHQFHGRADGALLDLGVSSLQLDRPERGFSIRQDGPLDMRMGPDVKLTAERFLNKASRDDLLYAVGTLGEEPRARAVVEAIMAARRSRPLVRTTDLKEIVEKVYGRRKGRIHPATKAFLGTRMFINSELENLESGLAAAFRLLKNGGRLAVISFHSGEDRIVKEFMKARRGAGEAALMHRGVITPSAGEIRRNRRSRSAKLRIARKESA